MKSTLAVLIVLLFTTGLKSQNIPTIREIYNFDVNDEFQTQEYSAVYAPFYGYQLIISNKSYSIDSTVVYYTAIKNKYTYNPNQQNPIYDSYTVNFSYTNLDSSITTLVPHFQTDSCNTLQDIVFTASNYCNAVVYKNTRCMACCFEGTTNVEMFGVGLGRLYYFRQHSADANQYYTMVFYKKGNLSCGSPDSHFTTVENYKKSSDIISIYPNPANSIINILIRQNYKLSLTDLSGRFIINRIERQQFDTEFNINFLNSGIYFLKIETKNGVYTQKLIKN